jgi:hypothetical protein
MLISIIHADSKFWKYVAVDYDLMALLLKIDSKESFFFYVL